MSSSDDQIAKLAHMLRICDNASTKGPEFLRPAVLSVVVTFGNVAIARMAPTAFLNHPGTASPHIIAAWVEAALDSDHIYPDSPSFEALCASYSKEP